ncbi:ABC transporter ATP-binding protein [Microvirga sp. 17 mud 1-3]|uniref:ABC transporter ATP-binding protein n=1 Tax=Microvirga sp. 17 mud 1-3 TaxID=2082949 RepID=UPI000D6BEF15|nr:ABC transporter ATP-binding protein [Microvirga sp. 17 mud 1-3]AWM87686.1 hypothetical protein C4E04_13725 [Microvirga sp. 17 mud 1-3]
MSDPIIELKHVSRVFRMSSGTKWQRIMTSLGLINNSENIQEFWALRDINLQIAPGHRLGIIGRNGAGKSTLLRIIAGLLQPSEGSVLVRGNVETMMHLGTGFHPDLTGRQNVKAALAHKGIFGKEAADTLEEIIDFTELDEFFDMPLRTYSSGMNARLGFATATAVKPEVLIIDEVLGAGDAYFASKSYERMRRLTSSGATVLFVSHDMSAVEQLCDDAIWLERGQLKSSGSTIDISRAYAASVRREEQLRMKLRNSMLGAKNFSALKNRLDHPFQLIVRIFVEEGNLDVSEATLLSGEDEIGSVVVGAPQDSNYREIAFALVDNELGRWSKPKQDQDGRFFRSISSKSAAPGSGAIVYNLDFIDIDQEWSFTALVREGKGQIQVWDGKTYTSIADFKAGSEFCPVEISIPKAILASFLASEGIDVPSQTLPPSSVPDMETNPPVETLSTTGEIEVATQTEIAALEGSADQAARSRMLELDVKSSMITITDVLLEDASGDEQTHFLSLQPMRIRIRYNAMAEVERPEFAVTFYREGVCALQVLSGDVPSNPGVISAGSKGEAVIEFPSLPIGRGSYMVSVAIFPQSVRTDRSGDHIAYALLDRRFQIKVAQPEDDLIDRGIARGPSMWSFSGT